MKDIYTHKSIRGLISRFPQLDKGILLKLCEWLKENDKFIQIEKCYDSRSGWHGEDFFIDKTNLSLNGYCLKNKEIELFISGGKNPMWYYHWEKEYKEAEEWQKLNI